MLVDEEQQAPPSIDGQSHLVFYKHKLGFCTLTCILLEASAESSRLVLYPVVFGYESPVELHNSVLFVDVSSGYLGGHRGEWCHSPALMLQGDGPSFASIPCDITPDTTDITNVIITGFGYCIYLPLRHQIITVMVKKT